MRKFAIALAALAAIGIAAPLTSSARAEEAKVVIATTTTTSKMASETGPFLFLERSAHIRVRHRPSSYPIASVCLLRVDAAKKRALNCPMGTTCAIPHF